MRLIRFPPRPTRASDDVRAALIAFRQGSEVLGGFALLGIRPPDTAQDVDAVLVLPQGVVIVVGIDLPHPAVRLQAPLSAPWKLDGWPLTPTEEESETNPAVGALTLARSVTDRIHEAGTSAPVGIILAVGPYVGHVEQPPVDLTEPIRIVHPTPATLLPPIRSLMPPGSHVLTAQQAGTLLHHLAPGTHSPDLSAFVEEGFTTQDREPAAANHPTHSSTSRTNPSPATHAVPTRTEPLLDDLSVTGTDREAPRHLPRGDARPPGMTPVPAPRQLRRTLRRAFTAVGALAVLATTAITIAEIRSSPETEVAGDSGDAAQPDHHVSVTAHGVTFREIASAEQHECSGHAIGDIDVWLGEADCTELQRRSLTTTVEEQEIAVSIATVNFSSEDEARNFQSLADTPGTGTITDIALERSRWPEPTPTFDHAAYTTLHEGTNVRVVRATSYRSSIPPDDPNLVETAEAALAIR